MDCPECGESVEQDVPAIALTNQCGHCGWLEIGRVSVTAAQRGHKRPWFDRDDSRCVLCGRDRMQVRKIILGAHGGICLDCVALCNDITGRSSE